MNSIQPKTKELAIHHCGCHGNLLIIAMRYMADAYCPKEPPYQILDSIRLKTKELLTYCCGCHGNLVTIAMRYVADAYCPKESPQQIWTQYDQRRRSYGHITVVAMVT